MSRYARHFRKAEQLLSDYQQACNEEHEEEYNLEQARAELAAFHEAQQLLQGLAQQIQEQAHSQISGVVTKCLEAVFEDRYQFQILFEQKRNRTEARLVFLRDGNIVDPRTAAGGGVVDVAAFALRLASLVLTRPPARRLLVLDEPFKFLSVDYRPRVRQLLEELSQEMGVQILMVTHVPELMCGKTLEL